METVQINAKYILQVGEPAKPRLNLLHRLHGKYSRHFIKKTIIQKPSTILDIGCGTGNMTCWLAEYFPESNVVGIDNSEQQLILARNLASKKNISNAKFFNRNLEELSRFDEKFDVIYCRYCLIHLHEPEKVVKSLVGHLNENGRIIIEEPTMSTAFCHPYNIAYDKSRWLLNKLAEINGMDFEIGKKLENILHDIGLKVDKRKLIQPLLETYTEKQMLVMITDECRENYLCHDLISGDEFSFIIERLNELIKLDGTLIAFPRTTQICATKITGRS